MDCNPMNQTDYVGKKILRIIILQKSFRNPFKIKGALIYTSLPSQEVCCIKDYLEHPHNFLGNFV